MNSSRPIRLISFIFLLLAVSLLALPSCKPDDGDPGEIPIDSTIKLTFKIWHLDPDTGDRVQGAFVGLAVTPAQRDAGQFIFSRTSDAFGIAKFEGIDTLNYYYNIDWVNQTQSYNKKGEVKLGVAEKKTLEITLK